VLLNVTDHKVASVVNLVKNVKLPMPDKLLQLLLGRHKNAFGVIIDHFHKDDGAHTGGYAFGSALSLNSQLLTEL